MTRDRSNGRGGREECFGNCSTFTQCLRTEKERRKDGEGEEEKCFLLEKEIPNGMLYCQRRIKPTCRCCNLQLLKLKDFFPLTLGCHLSEAYVDVANAQNLMYISCRLICVKSLYISCLFFSLS